MIARHFGQEKTEMNTEMISGAVADLRVIPTHSGKNMVTFTLGGKSCKAFGDNAANLQNLNGEQVTVAAKSGSYRGEAEYAVERIENPSGALNDASKPTSHPSMTKHPAREHRQPCDPLCVWLNDFIDSMTDEEYREWTSRKDHNFPDLPGESVDERKAAAGYPAGSHYKVFPAFKTRFESRLDEIREDLRRKASRAAEKADDTQKRDSPEKNSVRFDSARNPLG